MKEEQIRPENLFKEYLSLARKDAKTYFSSAPFRTVVCPACGSPEYKHLFDKGGFPYAECLLCGTLYANPRPGPDDFSRYYSEAPSIRYWASHFYRQTENARRELLIKPKARLVYGQVKRWYGDPPQGSSILDIGAGYGVFCEELRNLYGSSPEILAIEPSPGLYDACKEKEVPVLKKFFENVTRSDISKRPVVAATCFELLEHLADPKAFFQNCRDILDPGSLFILTTLNWHGFDLQVLRGRSKSIQPPAHVNFFTTHSIRVALERYGFEICEITTPGKLDADIVSKQLRNARCGFIRTMLADEQSGSRERFQAFLRESGLSSHMMVVAKRR